MRGWHIYLYHFQLYIVIIIISLFVTSQWTLQTLPKDITIEFVGADISNKLVNQPSTVKVLTIYVVKQDSVPIIQQLNYHSFTTHQWTKNGRRQQSGSPVFSVLFSALYGNNIKNYVPAITKVSLQRRTMKVKTHQEAES